MPLPDLQFGLLHQKLQMLNLCIARQQARRRSKTTPQVNGMTAAQYGNAGGRNEGGPGTPYLSKSVRLASKEATSGSCVLYPCHVH